MNASIAVNDASATLVSTAGLTIGRFLAFGYGQTNCEIRRITAVGASTVSISSNTKFRNTHTNGEPVAVLQVNIATWEMYGAVSDNSTDCFVSLRNALLDQLLHNLPIYGSGGNGRPTYLTTRPLWSNDALEVRYSHFGMHPSWAIDPLVGGWPDARPCQYLWTHDGNGGTELVTFDSSTSRITMSPFQTGANQEIQFYLWGPGAALPPEIEEGRKYWVVNVSGSTFQIAKTRNDTAHPVTFSTNGSGNIKWTSCGQGKVLINDCWFEGGNTQGMSGMMIGTAQPQTSTHVRVTDFPVTLLTWFAAQGYIEEWELFNGHIGIDAADSKNATVHACDIEQNDFGVMFSPDYDIDVLAGGPSISWEFTGSTHTEGMGHGTARKQALYVNTNNLLTGGTYTLTFRGITTTHNYNDDPATVLAAIIAGNSWITSNDLDVYAGDDWVDSAASVWVGELSGGTRNRAGITLNQQPFIFDFDMPNGQYRWASMKSGSWSKTGGGTSNGVFVVDNTGLTGGTTAVEQNHPIGCGWLTRDSEAIVVNHLYAASSTWCLGSNYGLTNWRWLPIVRFMDTCVDTTVGWRKSFEIGQAACPSSGIGFAIAYDVLFEPSPYLVLSNNGGRVADSPTGQPLRTTSFGGYKRMGQYSNGGDSVLHSKMVHWVSYQGRAWLWNAGSEDTAHVLRAGNGQTSALLDLATFGGTVKTRFGPNGEVYLLGALPTSDPHVVGQLYLSGQQVMRSAG